MQDIHKRKNIQIIYEVAMVLLAAVSISTLWVSTGVNHVIVWGTWAIFFVDFLVRFTLSQNKWAFIKENPFIVVAAIPLDAIFQLARIAQLLHLLRLKTITKYYTMPFMNYLKQQKVYVVIGGAALFILILIIPLYMAEPGLETYGQTIFVAIHSIVIFYSAGFEPTHWIGFTSTVIFSILGLLLHGVFISAALNILYNLQVFQQLLLRWKNRKE